MFNGRDKKGCKEMEWKFLNKDEIREGISHFVPLVNKDMKMSDKNEQSIAFFEEMLPMLNAYVSDGAYVLYVLMPDIWGNKVLGVMSFWVAPEKRSFGAIREVIRLIEKTAKKNGCKSVEIGSHTQKSVKMLKLLRLLGYEDFCVRKEL